MHNLHIETKIPSEQHSLSWSLAQHIATRYTEGCIAVIAKHPVSLMASVKRQWLNQAKDIQGEYETTFMKNLSFSARSPFEEPIANVLFSTAKEFKAFPPICRTLYVTDEVNKQDMYMITSWMPSHGLVIIYKD